MVDKSDKSKNAQTELEHVYCTDRAALRAWFQRHHKTKQRAFIVYYKKATGRPSVTYREALLEAICFGWIDTTLKRIDDERYGHVFVRRKPTANWSENTLRYAKELIAENLMSPQGLAAYELGKQKAPLQSIPKGTPPPADLIRALKTNKTAHAYFQKLSPSRAHMYIAWVLKAKRPETRANRITKLLAACAQQNHLQI